MDPGHQSVLYYQRDLHRPAHQEGLRYQAVLEHHPYQVVQFLQVALFHLQRRRWRLMSTMHFAAPRKHTISVFQTDLHSHSQSEYHKQVQYLSLLHYLAFHRVHLVLCFQSSQAHPVLQLGPAVQWIDYVTHMNDCQISCDHGCTKGVYMHRNSTIWHNNIYTLYGR